VDVIYWFTSHDPTGTTALALGACLGTLVGSYLLFTARRIEPRPEDLDDADISDGAGELGFFSPYSWAPLWCGLAAATCFLGLVFGWWLSDLCEGSDPAFRSCSGCAPQKLRPRR